VSFFCINCKANIEPDYKACPFCGEPITDFLRKHLEEPIDGKYQILSRLGVGGMGEVYKVLHIHLNSIRVIKLMRPSIATEENAHERFIREARLATKIHHPNVATLFDFSTLADGSYYMVWEYIEGTTLTDVIRSNGNLAPKYAAELSVQALKGLEAIHKVGIVHRDISPENLMMARDEDGDETVKIIDLGIAKQWGDSTDDKTKTGMFVGKWKYCSPEHLGMLKKEERIDGRADLYSYGIVLYEMLTGTPPFVADTPHRYLMMHSAETPRHFAEIDQETNIPAELEDVVFRSLEKDRAKRFDSAREFSRALSRILPNLPDEAKLPEASAYADEPTRQRPLTSGEPSSMKSTVTKKTITEETPIPTPIEEQAAFDRLTGTGEVPQGDEPTVRSQELVETMVTSEVAGSDPTAEATIGDELLRTGRTGEIEKEPGGIPMVAWLGIAGILLVVLVVLAVVFWPSSTPEPAAVVQAPAETATTTPDEVVTVAAPGRLGLQAFPWAEVVSIRNVESGEDVEMGSPIVTPGSIELPPGRYDVTLRHPDTAEPQTKSVEVASDELEIVSFAFRADPGYPDFGGGSK
jgi:serine/threonine-protein kinase